MSLNWAVSSPCGGGAALFVLFSVLCGVVGGTARLDMKSPHIYVMYNMSF